MPNWIAAYLAIYTAFVLWAYSEDFRDHRGITVIALTELGGNLALLLVALTRWLPSLRTLPQSLLTTLYVAGCALFVLHGVRTARKPMRDADLSKRGTLFVVASGSVLGMALMAPLFYWGWQAM
ncbi:hypothetical protein [Roseateles sp. P5_D6]